MVSSAYRALEESGEKRAQRPETQTKQSLQWAFSHSPTGEAGPKGLVRERWPWRPEESGRKSLVHSIHRPLCLGLSLLVSTWRAEEFPLWPDVSALLSCVAVIGIWSWWTEPGSPCTPVLGDVKEVLCYCIKAYYTTAKQVDAA